MDVRFVETTSALLSKLPIENGQVIALTDSDAYFYDLGNVRRPVSGIQMMKEAPSGAVGDPNKLYIVVDDTNSSVWVWNETEYVKVSGINSVQKSGDADGNVVTNLSIVDGVLTFTMATFPTLAEFTHHIEDTNNPHNVTKEQLGIADVDNTADADKVVKSAGKLTTPRNLKIAGDATGEAQFDGSADATIQVTLGASGVVAGEYGPESDGGAENTIAVPYLELDSKGRVINAANRLITLPSPDSVSGNAGTATKLETARKINGVEFDGSSDITNYAICTTPGATAEKAVTLTGFNLTAGALLIVRFTSANTADNPSINVNSLGPKAIRYKNETLEASKIEENGTYFFVYDGNYFQLVGGTASKQTNEYEYHCTGTTSDYANINTILNLNPSRISLLGQLGPRSANTDCINLSSTGILDLSRCILPDHTFSTGTIQAPNGGNIQIIGGSIQRSNGVLFSDAGQACKLIISDALIYLEGSTSLDNPVIACTSANSAVCLSNCILNSAGTAEAQKANLISTAGSVVVQGGTISGFWSLTVPAEKECIISNNVISDNNIYKNGTALDASYNNASI